jgi:hypothetical protein
MSDDGTLRDDGVSRHQPLPLARLDREEVACLRRELWRALKFFGAGVLSCGMSLVLITSSRTAGVRVGVRPPPPPSQNVASGIGGISGTSQAPDDVDARYRSGGHCDIGGEESLERSR